MTKVYDEAAKQKAREYYLANRERILASRIERKEQIKAWRRRNYAENREQKILQWRQYVEGNKDKHRGWMQKANYKHRQGLKQQVVVLLGGKCSCCGETELAFLSVEHVGRWGAQHRRNDGWKARGAELYRRIINGLYPKDKFDVLCMNCQIATKDGRECPHQKIDVQALIAGIAC